MIRVTRNLFIPMEIKERNKTMGVISVHDGFSGEAHKWNKFFGHIL